MVDGLYLLFKSNYSVATLTKKDIQRKEKGMKKEEQISFSENAASGFFLGRPLALSLPTSKGRLTRKDFMVRFAPILEATHETYKRLNAPVWKFMIISQCKYRFQTG